MGALFQRGPHPLDLGIVQLGRTTGGPGPDTLDGGAGTDDCDGEAGTDVEAGCGI
ncbi:hypothetical protein AB0F25_20130 [Streptomyces wedmorensis]|uniref:hypothetical protein n=1 Tax=Streptomyces wedmorensis TaxID=43759 RepID=UPI003434290A